LRVLPISDISWSIAASSLGLSCGTLGGVPEPTAEPVPEPPGVPTAELVGPAGPLVEPAVDPLPAAVVADPVPAEPERPAADDEAGEVCADVVCAGDEDDPDVSSPPPDDPEDDPEDDPPLAAGAEVVVPFEPEAGVPPATRPPHAASPAPRATAKTNPVASDFALTSSTAPPLLRLPVRPARSS
jgi:hypothetical protein